MQQIERFGVIALVFLLVTIVAVSFWGEDEGKNFWSRFRADEVPRATEVARRDPTVNAASTRRSLGNEIPLTTSTAAQRNQRPGQAPTAGPRGPGSQARTLTGVSRGAVSPGSAAGAGVPSSASRGQRAPGRRGQRQPQRRESVAATSRQPVTAERVGARGERAASVPRATQRTTPRSGERSSSFYVVESGDSLSVIAEKKLGSSHRWKEIQTLNGGIDPARLSVGMKLKLPAAGAVASTATRRETPAPEKKPERKPERATERAAVVAGGDKHIVRSGQTLSEIAQDRLGKSSRWKEIVALNPGVNPTRLVVGQALTLPADSVSGPRGALVADAGPSRSTAQRRAKNQPRSNSQHRPRVR